MLGIVVLLGSLVLALGVICAFLITQLPNKTWIKFILIPLVLAIASLTALNIKEIMGYPYGGVPTGHFLVEDVRMIGNGHGGMKIEFWALENGQSRLYSIPYNADIMNTLMQAMAAGKSGTGDMDLKFGKKGLLQGEGESYAYTLEGKFSPFAKALPPKREEAAPAGPAHPGTLPGLATPGGPMPADAMPGAAHPLPPPQPR